MSCICFRKGLSGLALFAVILSGVVLSLYASAETITFAKIADTSTPLPKGEGAFTGFSRNTFDSPTIKGGFVAFRGTGPGGVIGIFLYEITTGQISVVADTSTVIPGGNGTFTDFQGSPSVDIWGNVAFTGLGNMNQQGVYVRIAGILQRIADRSTDIPEGQGTFIGFGVPLLDEGKVVFVGRGNFNQFGIYATFSGMLEKIVDTSTPIPGEEPATFLAFNSAGLDVEGTSIAFRSDGLGADRTGAGTYTLINGQLTRVVSRSTPMPGFAGTFSATGNPNLHNGTIAFNDGALNAPHFGIYTHINGVLEIVADSNTPIPEGTGTFQSFGGFVGFNAGRIVFVHFESNIGTGIYTSQDGMLAKIIDLNDSLDGKTQVFC